jgi:hypothetical protein
MAKGLISFTYVLTSFSLIFVTISTVESTPCGSLPLLQSRREERKKQKQKKPRIEREGSETRDFEVGGPVLYLDLASRGRGETMRGQLRGRRQFPIQRETTSRLNSPLMQEDTEPFIYTNTHLLGEDKRCDAKEGEEGMVRKA